MIRKLYKSLLKRYGKQGWWPLKGIGYHPGDYSYPRTEEQRFEIICGSILTQNTSWRQVDKALDNLYAEGSITPGLILGLEELENLIRPAGYFNQKAERLRRMAEWFRSREGVPSRDELLSIKGIGKETADSILLYAYGIPSFVIDAYTRRILLNLGLIEEKTKYDEIKGFFEANLKRDYKIYQEYHALFVEHAKNFYQRRPYEDPISRSLQRHN